MLATTSCLFYLFVIIAVDLPAVLKRPKAPPNYLTLTKRIFSSMAVMVLLLWGTAQATSLLLRVILGLLLDILRSDTWQCLGEPYAVPVIELWLGSLQSKHISSYTSDPPNKLILKDLRVGEMNSNNRAYGKYHSSLVSLDMILNMSTIWG